MQSIASSGTSKIAILSIAVDTTRREDLWIGCMILHSMQCPAKAEVVRCRRLLKKVVVDTVIAVLIGLLGV